MTWTCKNCGTENDSNSMNCSQCSGYSSRIEVNSSNHVNEEQVFDNEEYNYEDRVCETESNMGNIFLLAIFFVVNVVFGIYAWLVSALTLIGFFGFFGPPSKSDKISGIVISSIFLIMVFGWNFFMFIFTRKYKGLRYLLSIGAILLGIFVSRAYEDIYSTPPFNYLLENFLKFSESVGKLFS